MKQIGKYRGLLDMVNGGGANAEGNEFKGGGLLSAIANAFATPYGSEDRMRDAMQAQRPMARTDGGFGNGSADSTSPGSPQLSPLEMFGGQQPAEYSPQLSPLERFGGQQPAEYSRPVQGSGMTPVNNYVAPPQTPQPEVFSPDHPLSFESFGNFILKNYDQNMALRMLSNSDQYNKAYNLFVRNGGRL